MRISWALVVTFVACFHHNYIPARAAPARTTDEILLGQVDIAIRNDDDSNEVTTKPFEKKCIVDGKWYSHAQVVSYDENSRCICVAGNVYCFWHGLPPPIATESSSNKINNIDEEGNEETKNANESTEPFCQETSSLSNDTREEYSSLPSNSNEADLTDVYKNIDGEKFRVDNDGDNNNNNNDDDDDDDDDNKEDNGNDNDSLNEDDEQDDVSSEENNEEIIPTSPKTNPPTTPVICTVLDRKYRVGEILPHNTGNCIECSCGPEGHVVCAPRDCVSIVPHRDYRGESFQIPIASDLRGIDENF